MTTTRRRFLTTAGLTASALAVGAVAPVASVAWGRAAQGRAEERGVDAMPDYAATGARLLTQSTPKQDGFYFPPEWAAHERTLMAFPPAQNWVGYRLRAARREWARIANLIQEFEPVRMVVDPADRNDARRLLSAAVERIELPINDGWTRDTGPLFLVNGAGERRAAGFLFNGWGAKFPPFADDALLKARLCARFEIPLYPADLVLEGGGVVLDGAGTAITTEQCLLHPNRNPGVSKQRVETFFAEYLGVSATIWLGEGLKPDPITDGHADGICAWAAPGVVLLHTVEDRDDPNYALCRDAKRRLTEAVDAAGSALEVVELPLTGEVAHMGFYFVNGGVIVPTADDPAQDDEPMAILRALFPDRQVVGVRGKMLARGGGSVHCITQQLPAV